MGQLDREATLLLTSHFGRVNRAQPQPLTPTEYGRFAQWLYENELTPGHLMQAAGDLLASWEDPKGKVTSERIEFLLGRGLAMGIALEKWQGAGLWYTSRADSSYPLQLKKVLGPSAPGVFYGAGNLELVSKGGLAVVGSRTVKDGDFHFSRRVSAQAASEGIQVVSGGARGVDETAMLGALEAGGTVLGILANDLLKTAVAKKWRDYIMKGQLCLISPYYPEASFHTGTAMGRNKYIYCLADFGLVVRSDKEKGGTWNGAVECLKKGYRPLFVRKDSDAAGNPALISQGAHPFTMKSEMETTQRKWLGEYLFKNGALQEAPVLTVKPEQLDLL